MSGRGPASYVDSPSHKQAYLDESYSTVRPVKKVDLAGSKRLSSEFAGASPTRPYPAVTQLDSPMRPRAALSARGRAGQALVEEVVLGILDSVSDLNLGQELLIGSDCGRGS